MAYLKIRKKLEADKKTKTLFFHIFSGHGVQKNSLQTVLVNEHEKWDKVDDGRENKAYDEYNHFYRRFMAEFEIRDIANKFPHSYHIGIFVCCRDREEPEYNFKSMSEALNYAKLNSISDGVKLEKKLSESQEKFRKTRTDLHNEFVDRYLEEIDTYIRETKDKGKNDLLCRNNYSNFAFLFGTEPADIVSLETHMVKDLL